MNRKRLFVALSAAAALVGSAGVISSCQPDNFNPLSGQPVRFAASTGGSASGTKAAYSGVIDSGKEMINWQTGDTLRVYCAQASEPGVKYADYGVTEVESSGSQAKIDGFGGVGLRWGDNVDHIFYAVYPSPAVKESDALENGTLDANIPATQVPVSLNDTATGSEPDFTAVPDLKSEYMVATNTIKKDSFDPDAPLGSDVVFLTFKPIVTAIEFTIKNAFENDGNLNIKNIQLISASHNIAGGFTADLTKLSIDAGTYPTCTSTSDGKTVTMDFTAIPEYDYSGNEEIAGSKAYVTVGKDQTLRFTLFLKPEYASGAAVNVDDLTFKIVKADDSWMSTKLAYNDESKTGIAFPCHKKTYVTGILVPEGAQWTVKYDPDVDKWLTGGSSEEDPSPETGYNPVVTPWTSGGEQDRTMVKYNYTLSITEGALEFGHEGTTGSIIKVSSQRELNHNPTPVVWHLEYWSDSESAWKTAKSGEQIDGFLTLNPTVGCGSGEDIELPGLAEINMIVEGVTASETRSASHDSRLRTAPAKGTADAPYDLSMHDIYGNERNAGKPITANCYVINAPGWYAIPLVYGNAIDSEAAPAGYVNVPAYNPGAELDPTPTNLTQFVNANGRRILEPYIESDAAEGQTGWTAEVLWKDAAGIAVDGCTVVGRVAAPDMDLAGCLCSYAVFHVDAEGLTQGNFVLSVKNGSQTMWSWHIWVTDNVLDSLPVSSDSPCSMLPLNLGWKDSDVTTPFNSYDGKSVKLRAVQSGSGATLEFEVVRRAEDEATHTSGSSLYWQWGRKDPFFSSPDKEALTTDSSIAYSIQHPAKFIYSASGKYQWYYETREAGGSAPQEAEYRNLWSAMNKETGTASDGYHSKPVKTIYDPCPPGFQVPQADAFSTISSGVLPANGYLTYDSGAYTASGGYYWNAVPSDGTGSYYTGSATGYAHSSYRASGYSVRPVQQ